MINNNINLYLRDATKEDCDLLFLWANDIETRKKSFHTDLIDYNEHIIWYNNILQNENKRQFILMADNVPVGQARIENKGYECEISYSISPDKRNKGYGKEIIRLIIEKIKFEFPEIRKSMAKVKPDNFASIKCFETNGFIEKYRKFEFDYKK